MVFPQQMIDLISPKSYFRMSDSLRLRGNVVIAMNT
jgi:hypothetical protein